MFNVTIAGGYLYGTQLFTWLSLVVSLMASFVVSFFPLDVLDEIWDLIESVSEGFLTYSFILTAFEDIYVFMLYTILSHNLIKDKLVNLIQRIFLRQGSFYILCNDMNAFFISNAVRNYNFWSCQKV